MLRQPLTLAAIAFAACGWHPAAHATAEWLTPAPTCVPDSPQTLDFAVTSLTGGFVRSAGRNPPVAYFCPVWNPDDLVATPSWKFLKLQALDPNSGGGSIVATLYAKSRSNGFVTPVASVSSLLSSIVTVASVALPMPLSFKRNAYYVTIQIDAPTMPAEAHMVMLTN
jgi:hypothetical protein